MLKGRPTPMCYLSSQLKIHLSGDFHPQKNSCLYFLLCGPCAPESKNSMWGESWTSPWTLGRPKPHAQDCDLRECRNPDLLHQQNQSLVEAPSLLLPCLLQKLFSLQSSPGSVRGRKRTLETYYNYKNC